MLYLQIRNAHRTKERGGGGAVDGGAKCHCCFLRVSSFRAVRITPYNFSRREVRPAFGVWKHGARLRWTRHCNCVFVPSLLFVRPALGCRDS